MKIWLITFLLLSPPRLYAGGVPLPVSDTQTEIQYLLFHASGRSVSDPVLCQLMMNLERPPGDPEPRWILVVQNQSHAAGIYQALQNKGIDGLKTRLRFMIMGKAYRLWARDFYAAFRTSDKDEFELMPLSPYPEASGERLVSSLSHARFTWPLQFTDKLEPGAAELTFAGGDLSSDDRYVYLGELTLAQLVKTGRFESREHALEYLQKLFKKEILILPGLDPHQDRYHLPVGVVNGVRTSLLADPVDALEILFRLEPEEKRQAVNLFADAYFKKGDPSRPDLEKFFHLRRSLIERVQSSEFVKSLDEVEHILQERGIRVLRIPTLHRKIFPDEDLPLGLYYVNIIQDTYAAPYGQLRRKAIFPGYGIGPLDERAKEVLEQSGAFDEIRPIRAIREGYLGAGMRCLVQIFGPERSSPGKVKGLGDDRKIQ